MDKSMKAIPDELWQHQKEVIPKALEKPYYALLFEQGTGKTPTMVTILRSLYQRHGRVLKTLIFCPQIVIRNWKEEIGKWSLCGEQVHMLSGTKKKRLKTLQDNPRGIFVTNYEALRSEGLFWKWADARKESRSIIDYDFEVMVLDESHRAKTHSAIQTKLLIRMADRIQYRYILTGTPFLNSEMDIWSQYRILDRGYRLGHSFWAFRNRYFVDKNAGMPTHKHFPNWQMIPGKGEELTRLIYQVATRVKKEECLDLPPLVKKSYKFDMTGAQRKAYNSMAKKFVAWVEDVRKGTVTPAIADIALTKGLRMLQICSGFVTDENGVEIPFDNNDRLRALKDILLDLEGKVIIWAVFKNNYADIAGVCKELGLSYAFITGQQNQKQKDDAQYEFTKGDTDILIANPGAGGTGTNLIEAATAIWYSRNFRLEHRLQALARNHRGGSEMHDKILCIDMVADDTIEERVLHALDHKENMAEALLEVP
jgi:SNF2 family DNA or RNA helicase